MCANASQAPRSVSAETGAAGPADNCFHCGEPNPPGRRYPVEVDGREEFTCCPGCQAVALTILGAGLESFYSHRDGPSQRVEEPSDFGIYDDPAVQAGWLRRNADGSVEADFGLEGL
ncbi:MAG: heavy metal translocating P-type ATPase metal-binding domain-containing protein, partial [Gammaproteobacteria bacterium]|nr:heavy metal translocating P-type ATPase metal-binding domain-containing protein [Gammaproteobacteria bacterium]